jgi:hypothetical protein
VANFKLTKKDYENGHKRINLLLPIDAVEKLLKRARKEGLAPTTLAKSFVYGNLNMKMEDEDYELPGQTNLFEKPKKRRKKK